MNIAKAGLALFAASLLVGCPAEEKQTDTTQASPTASAATGEAAATTTQAATTASAAAGATGASTAVAATGVAATAATGTAKPRSLKAVTAKPGTAKPAAGKTSATQVASNIDAKAIFAQKCAGCHGATGGGGMGPNLHHVSAKGDAFIHNRLMNGSPTKGMPAFGTLGMLKPAEIDAMVAFVKTL